MGQRGTAVARESADLVLLHDDFGSLVEALALGRRIEANLHRAQGYTLAIHLPIATLTVMPLVLPGQPMLLLPPRFSPKLIIFEVFLLEKVTCEGYFEK